MRSGGKAAVLCAAVLAALLSAPRQARAEDWAAQIRELEGKYRSGSNKAFAEPLAIAYNNHALELADRKEWDQAIGHLEKAHKLYPLNPQFNTNLSRIYFERAAERYQDRQAYSYQQSHFAGMKRDLLQATRIDPKFTEAYVLLGDVAYDSHKLAEARENWEKAKRLNPSLPYLDERIAKLDEVQQVESGFEKLSAAYFDLRFADGIARGTGYDMRQILLDARRQVGADLRYWPKHQIVVLLYDMETYRNTLKSLPEWSGGAYDGKIRIPIIESKTSEQWATQVVYHEYTHALVHDLTGGNCPKWFNEGLAEYQGQRAGGAAAIETAGPLRPVPWSQLDNHFASGSSDTARQGYMLAHSVVEFLSQRYGFWRLRKVLEDLGQGKDFDTALGENLRLEPEKLEAQWRAWLPRFGR